MLKLSRRGWYGQTGTSLENQASRFRRAECFTCPRDVEVLGSCGATALGLLRNIPIRIPDHVGVILFLRPGSVGNVAAPVVSAVPVDKDEIAALLVMAGGKAVTPHRRKDAVAAGIGGVVLRGGTKGRFGQ